MIGRAELQSTTYDRSDCRVGIVHIGFGAFHRAHQAVYVDQYMEATGDLNWGVAAVNLRRGDAEAFAQAASADGYILKAMSADGATSYQRVRPHIAFEDWSGNPAAAEALLALPSVSMATITVTESGYSIGKEGGLDVADPIIAAELAGGPARSVFAYLRAGLERRRVERAGPISILCCDNIRRNGKMLRRNFIEYLEAVDAVPLLDWLSANATFPCAMVDRITPQPTATLTEETRALFGPTSGPSIMAEDFVQWVLEDNFAGPRPTLEKVGVTITSDVDPFEEAKIRILNGGHTALTYLGVLAGHDTFDQAMADPRLNDHFWRYECDEVLPALTIDLPFDKMSYLETIAQRFQNQSIGDTLERISTDAYAKFPVFIRPTLEGCYAQGIEPVFGIRSVASWLVFARRVADGSLRFHYNEPNLATLSPLLPKENFGAFASSEQLWGALPAREPSFKRRLAEQIDFVEATWPV